MTNAPRILSTHEILSRAADDSVLSWLCGPGCFSTLEKWRAGRPRLRYEGHSDADTVPRAQRKSHRFSPAAKSRAYRLVRGLYAPQNSPNTTAPTRAKAASMAIMFSLWVTSMGGLLWLVNALLKLPPFLQSASSLFRCGATYTNNFKVYATPVRHMRRMQVCSKYILSISTQPEGFNSRGMFSSSMRGKSNSSVL